MPNDFGEQQPRETKWTPEQLRSNDAENAVANLEITQIGSLDDADITTESSIFIGGLILARTLEFSYLQEQLCQDRPESLAIQRVETGKYKAILDDARTGNFTALKEFVQKDADSWENTPLDEDSPEEEEKYKKAIKNMKLISERIPDKGDGSLIKIPNPAHMEEPVPLKVQLERFKAGGDIK